MFPADGDRPRCRYKLVQAARPVPSRSGSRSCTRTCFPYSTGLHGHVPRSREQPISCRMFLSFVPGTSKYSGRPICSRPDCSCAAHLAENLRSMLVRWFLKAEFGWNHHQSSHPTRVRVLLGVRPHSALLFKKKKNKERRVSQANTGTQPACSVLFTARSHQDNRQPCFVPAQLKHALFYTQYNSFLTRWSPRSTPLSEATTFTFRSGATPAGGKQDHTKSRRK